MNEQRRVRSYEVFDLTIDVPHDGRHAIRVLDSPYGQASELVRLPVVDDALRARLVEVETEVMTPRYDHGAEAARPVPVAQCLGAELFDAVFQGSVGRAYAGSQAVVRERGHGLRVQLRIRDDALRELPWECLYDADDGGYLALRVETSIVRFPEVLGSPRPFAVDGALRVLGVMIEAGDGTGLDLRGERLHIAQAFAELPGLVEVEWLENPTWRQLRDRILGEEWHVFHYVGHARPGFVTLDEDGGSEPGELSGADLAILLGEQRALRLAVINACEGARGDGRDILASTARTVAEADVSAVVAMQYKITDSAALEFSRAFYRSVAGRQSIDEAVVRARQAVRGAAESTLQWMVPVLHLRSADGALFAAPTDPDTGADGDTVQAAAAACCERARVHAEAERFRDAVLELDRAVQLRPDEITFRLARADANAAMGEYLRATEDLTCAIEARPDATDLYLRRGQLRYRVAYHGQTGNYRPAIEDFGRVLQNAPENAYAWYLRGRAHGQAAEEAESPEHSARAAADLAEATRRDDTEGRYHFYLGQAQARIGQRRAARESYLRAVQLGYADAWSRLGLWDRLFHSRGA